MTPSEPSTAELPDLVALADGLTQRDPAEAATVIQSVLGGVRELLGMDVAFVGEFRNGHRVFRHVDAGSPDCPVRPGQSDPLETTYCQRIVDGRLPEVVPDAAATPETAALSMTESLSIGTYVGVPITFSDGRVYGTFCTFSHQPDPGVRERDAGTLRLLATLMGRYLERDAARAARRSRAEADVLEVLALNALTTVFQPIIDLRSGRPAGFEALTRFPAGRPDEWFARAAEADLAVPLELAAVDAAVRHVPELPEGTYLAVNVSPGTLCTPQFEARAAELPLHRLVLELTEQTEVSSYSDLAARVDWIRGRGGRVAVDDAGAGYAGLQRIVTISPDILKLDSHFTRGVVDDAARQAMAAAMGWFAERIDAKLVVEGVETRDELEALQRLGVEYVQGYHTGRPRSRLG
jgi:EAL domain-containing protein (putative c-di-GMP-specific phosphodiesterase class I)